ncbi:sensor histidine kinase [Azospirillum sp. CT11-132]|uniref:sensor histidine kinase n=1 Tax=Azospirillum sp. CT11-132 TaxID=3396317 RepID=UPI0039A561CC
MGSDRPVWQLFARFSLLSRGPVARYGMALLTFATALLLRQLVDNTLPSGFPYLTFFPAVILTTFMAGLGPGVVTAVLSGLAAWYFFIPPFDSFGLDGSVGLALAFYAVVVAVDIALIHGMQMTLARLQEERGRTASLLEAQTTMFHELQHRVANNMQFVSALLDLQRRTVGHTPEGALAALEEAGRRLHTMAQVHRRLHDPRSGDDFGSHVEGLCRDMLKAAGVPGIDCRVTVQAAPKSPERLLALAMLIVEALTNSLKHAFAEDGGTVTIDLRAVPGQPDQLHLLVMDDGIGLPDGFDVQHLPSLGWKIIQSLAAQLSGELSYGATGGSGTRIELRFPA